MGRERRQKRQTEFYRNEQEPVCDAKKVKARHDSNRQLRKTLNKKYNNIQEMLGGNNVSNEDTCRKMVEIEDSLDNVKEAVFWVFYQDIPTVGTEVNIYFCKVLLSDNN